MVSFCKFVYKKFFKLHTLLYGEPMQSNEFWWYRAIFPSLDDDASGAALHIL